MKRNSPFPLLAAILAILGLTAAACGFDDSSPDPASLDAAVANYAAGVHSSYRVSFQSAMAMDAAIDAFVEAPGPASLKAARQAWLVARDDYGPTEAFRFYGGPIDDEATGTEGLINAWPLDEAYIDYVEGASGAGIVNDPDAFPVIDAGVLVSLNEEGGEANVSTGWHAIEFLLWGQDLSLDGPGDRPFADYTTAPNADRRAAYLATASDLLVSHLRELVDAWAPGGGNYRAEFESASRGEALRRMITGIGELSRGELAGERMNVAYSERSQEDEHSCFSDNTVSDIIGNARGIEMVLTGSYPGGVSGPGVLDLVREADADLAGKLKSEVWASLAAVRAIPSPFDRHLVDGVSDDDPGRRSVLAGIEALEAQTDTIVDAAEAIGVTINVS